MYSMLKFIKSKYHYVLTDEHRTELVRTALAAYQPNFNNLTACQTHIKQIEYFFLKPEHF
jgi:hypothetical protein